jgi:Uma2 family endonuclease
LHAGGEAQGAADLEGDVFGRGIQFAGKRGDFVQVAVVPGGDDRIDEAFELVEIHDDTDRVELGRGDGDAGAPVVAVEGFEGIVVEAEGVCGGEFSGGGDLEGHRRDFEGRGSNCKQDWAGGIGYNRGMSLAAEQTGRSKSKKIGRMSEAEFVRWCDSDTWAEWVDGEVILMSPVNLDHAKIAMFMKRLIAAYVEEHDLGDVIDEPYQVRLGAQRRRRSPDILFVTKARAEILTKIHVEGAPDLIVEVVSPESQGRDWREKYLEYETAGVREYWIIDPMSRVVAPHGLTKQKKFQLIEQVGSWLPSGVLPGFALKPDWLWGPRLPKVSAAMKEISRRK